MEKALKRKTFEQASLGELWFLSYPLIVTMAAQVVMQFVDRMFLSWYSHDALAACVPAGVLAMTFGALFMGLASYTSVFISQYYAQKKYASVSISLWQGILLAFISALILASLTPLGGWIIRLFAHSPTVTELELKYFFILNLFGGFAVINNALASFFSGRGQTKVPMWVTLFGNLINIALDYVMIFGKMGFAEMGVVGAAWATVLGSVSMTLIFAGLIFAGRVRKRFKIAKLAGFYKPVFSRLLRFGLPNGFGFLMDIMSFTLFTFMVGNIDVISLQASNIVMSMQPMVVTVILGLGIGIQILVSKYQGINRSDLSVKVVKNACKLGYAYAGAVGVLFFFMAQPLVDLFVPPNSIDAAAISAKTYPLMKLVSAFVLFDATYLIFGEAIRGAGDTKFFMKIMLFCAWGLMIPGAWWIIYKLQGSVFMVWSWLTFYTTLTAVIMLARFLQGKWKSIKITAG